MASVDRVYDRLIMGTHIISSVPGGRLYASLGTLVSFSVLLQKEKLFVKFFVAHYIRNINFIQLPNLFNFCGCATAMTDISSDQPQRPKRGLVVSEKEYSV